MASIVCSSISSEKTSTTSTSSIAEAGSSASVEAVRGRGGYNYTDPKLAFPHSSSFAGQGSNKAFTKAALAASTSQSANSLRGAAESADISSLRKDTTKSTTSTSAVISHSSAASTPSAASFKAVKSNSEAKTKPEAAKAVPSASSKNVSPVKARKGPPPPPKV